MLQFPQPNRSVIPEPEAKESRSLESRGFKNRSFRYAQDDNFGNVCNMPSAIPRQKAFPAKKSRSTRCRFLLCHAESRRQDPLGRECPRIDAPLVSGWPASDQPGSPVDAFRTAVSTPYAATQRIFFRETENVHDHACPAGDPVSTTSLAGSSVHPLWTNAVIRTDCESHWEAQGRPRRRSCKRAEPRFDYRPCHRVIGSNGKLVGYGGGTFH